MVQPIGPRLHGLPTGPQKRGQVFDKTSRLAACSWVRNLSGPVQDRSRACWPEFVLVPETVIWDSDLVRRHAVVVACGSPLPDAGI
jgi:hypothetical protein